MLVKLLPRTLALAFPAAPATVLYQSDFSAFAGRGLAPGGPNGTLDSLLWSVSGLSDGDSGHGDTRLGGDFARGISPGAVGAGGLYAFETSQAAAGRAPGFQPTGSDLTPGALTLELVNRGGQAYSGLALSFDLLLRNDGARSSRVWTEVAVEGVSTGLPTLALLTPGRADRVASWTRRTLAGQIDGLAVAPGSRLEVRWHFDDAGGSGARDEIALDRITLRATTEPGPAPVSEPEPAGLIAAGLTLGACWRRRHALPIRNARASRA